MVKETEEFLRLWWTVPAEEVRVGRAKMCDIHPLKTFWPGEWSSNPQTELFSRHLSESGVTVFVQLRIVGLWHDGENTWNWVQCAAFVFFWRVSMYVEIYKLRVCR